MDHAQVFAFLSKRQAAGEPCVLITVCAVEGSSMRNPGTHMAVAASGAFAGSLSGGCIENAVVAEALDALKAGAPRVVRFGAGSPYLDIKLPCGGGLDVHFQPLGDDPFVSNCCAAISSRQPFSVQLTGGEARCLDGWRQSHFDAESTTASFSHWPQPRLLIIGHGAGVEALAGFAQSMDCDVDVLTPDERIERQLKARSIAVERLSRTGETELISSDAWTAITFMFHDHDWEIELMAHALSQPHFYIGAMGGRRAHAMRTEALIARGISEKQIATIRAPIGLFHSSRDPHTLALSTLAEVIRTYQDKDFESAIG
jgi:xanthine dehydrogenase accessory factor